MLSSVAEQERHKAIFASVLQLLGDKVLVHLPPLVALRKITQRRGNNGSLQHSDLVFKGLSGSFPETVPRAEKSTFALTSKAQFTGHF